jgi:hypothetical protein
MKKLLPLLTLLFVTSCGVQKAKVVKETDPYVGSYEMTVFEVDNFGDLPLYLDITKEGAIYKSSIRPREGMQGVEFEIDGTTLEDGILTIEAYAAGYDIYFEITIEGDAVSGTLMGMFDLEGTRIQK